MPAKPGPIVFTPVKQLADEHLLNEFAGIERWSGDDFAVDPVPPKYLKRKEQARKEILRRMAVPK